MLMIFRQFLLALSFLVLKLRECVRNASLILGKVLLLLALFKSDLCVAHSSITH